METKQNKSPQQTGWKTIVQGFVSDILERIGEDVSKRVHVFITQLKKRTIGAILILIGCLFLLISAAMLINAVLGNEFPWVGWGLVGLVIGIVGYFISKD